MQILAAVFLVWSNGLIAQPVSEPFYIELGSQAQFVFLITERDTILAQHYDAGRYVYLSAKGKIQPENWIEADILPKASCWNIQYNADSLWLTHPLSEQPFFTYHLSTRYPADSLPDYYARSGFIHPLRSPNGHVITEDFPKGHVHQHGLFKAWTKTDYHGQIVDFWNQQKEEGSVRHDSLLLVQSGPIFCRFKIQLSYYVPHRPDQSIITEYWDVLIFAPGPQWIFDIHTTQNLTQPGDSILLSQYHYGGMALRAHDRWNYPGAYGQELWIQTSDQRSELDGNHTRPQWVQLTGRNQHDQYFGVRVIPDVQNFKHPEFVRIHPSMPYFCFIPFVDQAHEFKSDEEIKASYRFEVFDGLRH